MRQKQIKYSQDDILFLSQVRIYALFLILEDDE